MATYQPWKFAPRTEVRKMRQEAFRNNSTIVSENPKPDRTNPIDAYRGSGGTTRPLAQPAPKPKKKGGLLSKAKNLAGDIGDELGDIAGAGLKLAMPAFEALDIPARYTLRPAVGALGYLGAEERTDEKTGIKYTESPSWTDIGQGFKELVTQNPLDSYREGKKAMEGRLADPNLTAGGRILLSGATDPLTYLGPGMVGRGLKILPEALIATRAARNAAAARTAATGIKAAPQARLPIRAATNILEAPRAAAVGGLAGSALGAEGAERAGLGEKGQTFAALGGGLLGGTAASLGSRLRPPGGVEFETPNPKRLGKETTVKGRQGDYGFRYRLVDLDDLTTSHDPWSFAENPGYVQAVQPRNRGSLASRSQVELIERDLDPVRMLAETGDLQNGVPIVGPDGLVESGNGRTMGTIRAAQDKPAVYARYVKELHDRLDGYGISRGEMESISKPFLIRERRDTIPNFNRQDFADEANGSSTLRMGAVETARSDAGKLNDELIHNLDIPDQATLDQVIMSPRSAEFVRHFMARLPENERSALQSADGLLNATGVQRIKAAFFAKAYPGPAGERLLADFFESPVSEVKNIRAGMEASLPAISQLEAGVRAGRIAPELAIAEDIASAADAFARLKSGTSKFKTVSDFLNQSQMFPDPEFDLNDRAMEILRFMDAHSRAPKQLREALRAYANAAIAAPPPGQGDLFGGVRGFKEIWQDATGRILPEPDAVPQGGLDMGSGAVNVGGEPIPPRAPEAPEAKAPIDMNQQEADWAKVQAHPVMKAQARPMAEALHNAEERVRRSPHDGKAKQQLEALKAAQAKTLEEHGFAGWDSDRLGNAVDQTRTIMGKRTIRGSYEQKLDMENHTLAEMWQTDDGGAIVKVTDMESNRTVGQVHYPNYDKARAEFDKNIDTEGDRMKAPATPGADVQVGDAIRITNKDGSGRTVVVTEVNGSVIKSVSGARTISTDLGKVVGYKKVENPFPNKAAPTAGGPEPKFSEPRTSQGRRIVSVESTVPNRFNDYEIRQLKGEKDWQIWWTTIDGKTGKTIEEFGNSFPDLQTAKAKLREYLAAHPEEWGNRDADNYQRPARPAWIDKPTGEARIAGTETPGKAPEVSRPSDARIEIPGHRGMTIGEMEDAAPAGYELVIDMKDAQVPPYYARKGDAAPEAPRTIGPALSKAGDPPPKRGDTLIVPATVGKGGKEVFPERTYTVIWEKGDRVAFDGNSGNKLTPATIADVVWNPAIDKWEYQVKFDEGLGVPLLVGTSDWHFHPIEHAGKYVEEISGTRTSKKRGQSETSPGTGGEPASSIPSKVVSNPPERTSPTETSTPQTSPGVAVEPAASSASANAANESIPNASRASATDSEASSEASAGTGETVPPPRPEAPPPPSGPPPPLTNVNDYEALGLNQNTTYTDAEIKSAYRAQARRYHPDINKSDTATADMKRLNNAFDNLTARTGAPRQQYQDTSSWQRARQQQYRQSRQWRTEEESRWRQEWREERARRAEEAKTPPEGRPEGEPKRVPIPDGGSRSVDDLRTAAPPGYRLHVPEGGEPEYRRVLTNDDIAWRHTHPQSPRLGKGMVKDAMRGLSADDIVDGYALYATRYHPRFNTPTPTLRNDWKLVRSEVNSALFNKLKAEAMEAAGIDNLKDLGAAERKAFYKGVRQTVKRAMNEVDTEVLREEWFEPLGPLFGAGMPGGRPSGGIGSGADQPPLMPPEGPPREPPGRGGKGGTPKFGEEPPVDLLKLGKRKETIAAAVEKQGTRAQKMTNDLKALFGRLGSEDVRTKVDPFLKNFQQVQDKYDHIAGQMVSIERAVLKASGLEAKADANGVWKLHADGQDVGLFDDVIEGTSEAGKAGRTALTDIQNDALDIIRKNNESLNGNIRFYGGKPQIDPNIEGDYFGRRVISRIVDTEGGPKVIERAGGGEQPRKVGATRMKSRVMENVEELLEKGYRTEDPWTARYAITRGKLMTAGDSYVGKGLKPLRVKKPGSTFGLKSVPEHPAFNGSWFDPEIAARISKGLEGPKRGTLDSTIRSINGVLTPIRASFDLSASLQQGLRMWLTNPVTAAEFQWEVMRSLKDPDVYDKMLLRLNAEGPGLEYLTSTNLRFTGEGLAREEFALPASIQAKLEGAQGVAKIGAKPLEKGFELSNQHFGRTLNAYRIHMANGQWKRLKALGLEGAELDDAMKANNNGINRAFGWTSSKPTTIEEAAIFAPRYFRASIETLMKTVEGIATLGHASPEAAMARNHMALMLSEGAALVFMINTARGKETEFNPTDPNFLRIRDVGGVDITPFGTYNTLFRAIAGAVAGGDYEDQPVSGRIGQLWRVAEGKMSPGAKLLYEPFITKQTYMGKPLDPLNDPLGAAVEQLKSSVPFGVQNLIEEGPTAAAIGSIGLGNTPLTPAEHRDAARDEHAQKMFDQDYDDLTGAQKSQVNEQEEVSKHQEEVDERSMQSSGDSGRATQIRQQVETELNAAMADLQRGTDESGNEFTGNDFRKAYNDTMTRAAGARSMLKFKGGDEQVNAWFDLYDEAKMKNGQIDYDKLERLQAEYRAEHPNIDAKVDKVVGVHDNQAVRDLRAAKKLASTYYKIPAYRGMSLEEAERAQGIISEANDMVSFGVARNRADALRRLGARDAEGVRLARRATNAGPNAAREQFRKQNKLFATYYSDVAPTLIK